MNINPGEFNKSIAIYSKSNSVDADGYPTVTQTLVHSCLAKFSRTSGTEQIKSGHKGSLVRSCSGTGMFHQHILAYELR